MDGREVENAKFDPTDPGGTYRPDLPPTTKKGVKFTPLKMPYRDPEARDLSDTPMGIFRKFLPDFLVKSWADATNQHARACITKDMKQHSRLHRWQPTSTAEIFVFIAIVICMQNHPENAIETFWHSSTTNIDIQPFYFFTRHMTLNRFEALFRHIRVFDDATVITERAELPSKLPASKAYHQVNQWSRHIQDTMEEVYIPGTHIAVDECIQGFTGRSTLKTYIPNKPTPYGIKIWVVAQGGIFLRWLWHEPGKGPIGIEKRQRSGTYQYHLTPTQRVVVALLNLLPKANYHVFLDNLFTSPDLFKHLYDMGIGASGTARINCGIHKDLVEVKKKPDPSTPWGWTLQIPSECEKVFSYAKPIKSTNSNSLG